MIALLLLITQAHALDLSQHDKQKHLVFSTGTSLVTSQLLHSAGVPAPELAGISLTILAGHIKECRDVRYDMQDMQANILGALVGGLMSVTIRF